MSIIQRIRDKAAWLIFGAIALAMIGFIVTDAFHGRGGGWFGGSSTTMGKVNGKKIDYVTFSERMKAYEAQAGGAMNDALRQNMQDNLWNQMVEEALMEDVYDDLGLYVSDKEVGDILYGRNPPQQLQQQFVDQTTGQYDANAAFQAIQALKKRSPKEYNSFVESIIGMRQREKYVSLVANTTYIPKWMVEKASADASLMASISYINIPYSTVADSAVTVSDQDIKDYISKRSDEFKQEDSRAIAYVAFNANPSAADSAAVRQQMLNLKPEYDTATDFQAFFARNGSETAFSDAFVTQSNMHMPNADSIRALPVGGVFGPYLDAGNFVMAKMIDKRSMPDTVKVRHILMSTQAQPDSVAKRRIDSVARAIAGGADFKTLAAQVSEDPGVKQNGGDYTLTSMTFSNWAPEFAQAAFYGKVGDKKTVKTSFGWHYIEVLEQKKIEPAYKVAYFTKSVIASTETDNAASGLANQFAGESRDMKSFDANVAKYKYNKIISPEIRPTDMAIANLEGSNRQFIRDWVYKADIGDVSEPYRIGDKYIVAVLTEINKEGTMSPHKARPMVEVLIRNKKKAAQIIQKLGKPATLEAAASSANQTVQRADSLSFGQGFIPNAGQEAKVIGAAFNKAWQGKVTPPIGGNGGVFVLRTESIFARANPNADVEQQRNMMMLQQRSSISYRAIEVMKKSATIKDNRGKFL